MFPQTRLFVGNLPEHTNEKDLKSVFSSYGEITNLDLKSKPADESSKNFAFITLSASYQELEQCIKHFSLHEFNGQKLYVTRARESFLERLKRERDQAHNNKETNTVEDDLPKKDPVIKLSEKLNPRKRKTDHPVITLHSKLNHVKKIEKIAHESPPGDGEIKPKFEETQKKQDSDKKRVESLKKKRQEFKSKQMIIKTGLIEIDKVQNKKIIFPDDDDTPSSKSAIKAKEHIKDSKTTRKNNKKNALFDENDDSSGDEVTFDVKKQFEGKKGQKVLDLQSRYKSDKRFALDERFIEESEDEKDQNEIIEHDDKVEMGQVDEKAKQLNILQNVLGVPIRSSLSNPPNNKKQKSKIGMLRFDPLQPEHAKFLAPVEEKQEAKRSKKKKKEKQEDIKLEEPEAPKVEVSKEQFYNVSETLKEAIAQPTTFSLRSLFGNNDEESKKDGIEQEIGFKSLEMHKDRKKKVKNPMEPGEKNPFVYDSSDSEDEDKEDKSIKMETIPTPDKTEVKAIWKENLFFSISTLDYRFNEGLAFFNKPNDNKAHKERRELKSLMKKRIYNKDRKNQMFQKKIGGRKKIMKKSYRKKN